MRKSCQSNTFNGMNWCISDKKKQSTLGSRCDKIFQDACYKYNYHIWASVVSRLLFFCRMNEPSYNSFPLCSFILPVFASLSFEERIQDKTTVPTFRRRVNSTIAYRTYRLECFIFFYSSVTNNSREQWAHETKICVKCKSIGSKFHNRN